MFNEEAIRKYYEKQAEIQIEINRLQNQLADHDNRAKSISLTHVADMSYILSELKKLNGEENE